MKGLLTLALMVSLLALGNTAAAQDGQIPRMGTHQPGDCPTLAGKYDCHHPKKGNYTREMGQATDASGVITYWNIKDGKRKAIKIADGQKHSYTTRSGRTRHKMSACVDNTLHIVTTGGYNRVDFIYSFEGDNGLNMDTTRSVSGELRAQYRITCQRLND